jgi:16S rRNA (guanine966-N2)-methyltransferase
MRVIAGKAKGHQLAVPRTDVVRPATDLVRGAVFSILESMADDWSRVLDLYSGSGAMGIESLSRGADWADFVDRQQRCCDIIKQNLTKTKLADQAHVYCCNVTKAVSFLKGEYGIIIMDPPYANSVIGDVITQVANSELVGSKTVIIVTHSPHLTLESAYGPVSMIKEHRHGDSCIAIYKKENKQCPPPLPSTQEALTQ